MIKAICVTAVFFSSALYAFAQKDSTAGRTHHYIGLQANQLIRQIFNFSNSNNPVNNPYLLVYSFNSARTGHGLNVGLGYTINEFDDGDNITKRETNINEFFFRLGYERKSVLRKKWIASYGFDVILDNIKNETIVTNDSDFNNSKIETNSKNKGYGMGPRFTLNYSITDRILVGTEATYYYRKGKSDFEVKSRVQSQEVDPITGQLRTVIVNSKDERTERSKQFQLKLPVAFYLIIKM